MATMDSVTQNTDSTVNGNDNNSSAASKLMHKHVDDHTTVEDVPDKEDIKHGEQLTSSSVLESKEETTAPAPSWVPPMSAKAAGKQKAQEELPFKEKKALDTHSHDLFPELGSGPKAKQTANVAPIWGSKKSAPTSSPAINGISTNGTSRASTPTSGMATPPSAVSQQGPRIGPQSMALPGRHQERISLDPLQMLPRNQMKKPLPDILKDINKKSKATVTTSTGGRGILWISAAGPEVAVRHALHEVVAQIGSKLSVKVLVPQSARAHIIGKQGSKIKELQDKTGARIQVPKMEDTPSPADEDDDVMIPVLIEGNAITAESARKEVLKIANERTATMNTKLRGIPAEFYSFIAGPHSAHATALEEAKGVQVRVPPHHIWTSQPPPQIPPRGQNPTFLPAAGDNHIALAGDRAAVLEARAEIERRVEELRQQLMLDQFPLSRGRHQFIVGDQGIPPQEFFAETGCAVILPGDPDDDMITIVGPPDQLQAAMDRAMSLASEMQSNTFDISRLHKNAPGGAAMHALNVTRYLRERREIERLENLHRAHIVTPISHEGTAAPWELYSRDGKNAIRAQSEIDAIVRGHPPSRMTHIPIDPFFHQHLRNDITPRVKKEYGVRVVIPNSSEANVPVLLVYEGPDGIQPEYQIPRGQPSVDEVRAFQQGLEDARKHILDLINAQAEIISKSIDVPHMFHEKLRRYIKQEQQDRAADQIPVRVTASGTVVTLRGPAPAVETFAAKVNAFVEQTVQDEKERGFTMSFDFPQKHANQLIGKGGSNIRELRDKFDVEIQINDGKVELKGPKAKAEAAKSHISALGRQWADKTTYTLKIEPKYHRELIGAQGSQINKLQTRYKVQIHFPRSAQSTPDGASESGRKPRREQEPDEVIVKGPKKGADDARDEILSLLQYLKDNSFTASVSVQQSQVPSLIGARGSGMDDLRQMTGAKIDVPNARDSKDSSGKVDIQIRGTKSQVAQAKKLLEEKKSVFDQSVSRTLEVDKKHHRALIGSGGSNLRDIVVKAGGSDDRRELARTVQFPKAESDGNSIRIEGNKDVVEKIIAAMQRIIAEREDQTTNTIEVPAEKHRSLIGRGGEIKKDLEARFRVSIDIPRQGNGTGIKITGLPTDVENAKTHILGLVQEKEGETVQVPKKLHHIISDNGQFFRRLKNDHRVTVDHAGEKTPPKPAASTNTRTNGNSLPLITDNDETINGSFTWNVHSAEGSDIDGDIPWVLRGPPDNIPKAKALLSAAIEQALTHKTTGYLTLPDPRSHRFVIGPGGKNVNSIRQATSCKITVPRDSSKDDAIEVCGSAEGVEKAKELILQAVKDGNAGNGNRS